MQGSHGGDGSNPFAPGSLLDGGRYVLDRELGRGGFGTVFLAREEHPLRRPVVIKLPHVSLLQQPGFVERFQAEIGHLASLEHSCIVKIYGAGVERGLPYAVVQYLPGGDLSSRLHSGAGTLPPHRILEWLPGIAGALDYMHQQGVLHRDIKPDNILFDAQGQAYLSDFGISKAITDSQDGNQIRTQTGMFVGAPAYVAPEYVDRKFTAACDQYSLAVVLYEALSGRRPHEADTAERLIIKKATESPAPLDQKVSGLSPGLVAAVMRGLSTRPEERFDSCSELAQAFAAALPGSAPVPKLTNSTAPGVRTPAAAATTLPAHETGGSRRAATIAGVLILALLLPLGWWLSQNMKFVDSSDPPSPVVQPQDPSLPELAAEPIVDPPPSQTPTTGAAEQLADAVERPAPIAQPARITIDSDVPGAQVFANGRAVGRPGVPIEVPAGEVSLRVEAPGHAPYTESLSLEPGATASTRVALTVLPATVTVRSNVSGDRLFIDGKPVGSTGPAEHELPVGRPVEIRVVKPGYVSFEESLTLEPGASHTLRASLRPKPQEGMALVPSSRALFGCNPTADLSCYADEVRAEMRVLPDFLIDETEVSVADYEPCVAAGACSARNLDFESWDGRKRRSRAGTCNWKKSGRSQHPINCVSWNQAVAYCEWRDKRLPSEAEWEKAARGNDGRKYPWGNVEYGSADKVANIADRSARRFQPMWIVAEDYDDGYETTAPVGSLPNGKSPSGALDMIGNVWEWTADTYDGSSSLRVARGGSFSDAPRNARASDRIALAPSTRIGTGGFRCAR